MIIHWGSKTGELENSAGFQLLLNDSGSGAVNTTPQKSGGVGTPTFTRATAAAARLSTGLWKLDVASGTARSHYHEFTAGTMIYGGYLAEPAATQILTAPRDMTNGAWVASNITVALTGTGMDGVVNSCSRLTCTSNGGSVLQTITAAASSRTYGLWIKRVTGTGTITIQQTGTTSDVTASINSTTFTQVQLNASILNVVIGVVMGTSGDVILVDCNQFEAGAVATTPIPAAGTRNADVLSYVLAGNGDVTVGSTYAELTSLINGSAPSNLSAIVVGGRAPFIASAAALTTIATFDGANTATKSGITSLATGVRKRACSWGAGGLVVTGDGATVATATFDGDMGAAAVIGIGNTSGVEQWTGTIKNVRIWLTQLTDAQIQYLTT